MEFSQFIGPVGGLLCIAWAMGSIAGYAFYAKTAMPLAKELHATQVKMLEDQNKALIHRLEVLEARYESHGTGRIKLLDKGEIIDVGPGNAIDIRTDPA